jgi:mannose-1-phosphate guanylyltransferase
VLRAVIMAGGSGTRFWPQSRRKLPKQFLTFHGHRSLLQQAFDRIVDLVGIDGMLVVTNCQQVDKTREQLPALTWDHIIGEPCGRDTAACIGLAAALLVFADPNARMIVLAADHLIDPTPAFHAAVRVADDLVLELPEALVTFGIRPTRPATGYGYLKRGPAVVPRGAAGVFKLESFHEKPSQEKAHAYLESGEYYWNSGIFCWRADAILAELERRAPQLSAAVGRIADSWYNPRRDAVFAEEYQALQKVSIDYAVMEQAANVYMVEAPFQWDDVGSWLALERVFPLREGNNVILGNHRGLKTRNCVIVGEERHLVATIGIDDLIVVHTPDVTFVAHKSDEQTVKQLLAELEAQGLIQYL